VQGDQPDARVLPYGDAGLLVEFGGDDREARWRSARDLGARLRSEPPLGVVDAVASFTSVFIGFDPLVTDAAAVALALRSDDVAGEAPESRIFTLPVLYGGDAGPDLDQVADELGLSADELIALHTAEPWTVRLVGSPAGAPLMEGPPLPASLARLANPRTRVQPGSVGLSGMQSIIYNAPSPGGWKLIGRTPLRLFDVTTPPHVRYRPGDRMQFTPIGPADWDSWAAHTLVEAP